MSLKFKLSLLTLGILAICEISAFATPQTISISTATNSFLGPFSDDRAGSNLVKVGDLNGDGYGDFIIGAPSSTQIKGKAYILYGKSGASYGTDRLLTVSESSILGAFAAYYTGDVVASNGNMNGDVYNDFAVAAKYTCRVDIFAGKQPSFAANTSTTLSDKSYKDSNASSLFGNSISMDGDVNGDGYDDLLIGAPQTNTTPLSNNGTIYLSYGSATLSGRDISPANLISFTGEKSYDEAGYKVAIIPDVNKDGFDDLLIMTYNEDQTKGKVYLFYGKREAFTSVSLSNADAVFVLNQQGDLFATDIAGLGDIKGDGYGAFAIGCASNGSSHNGAIYVFYGKGERFSSVNIVASADMILTGESGEYVGERGLAAGDFNGDDINDLLIGAFRGNSARGKVYSFYGGKGLTGQQALSSVSDFIYTGENLNDQAGYSVSSAGDINADGIDEFLIGAPYFSSSSLQNNGKTVLLKQAQNVTPSVITSIRVLNASSQAVTQVNNRQELIIEMVANDPDATMRNIAIAQVSSDGFTRPIKVRLVETTASSGIYRGRLFLVRSRSSDKLNQLSANNGDKIHVQCNGVSLSSEPTVINAAPYITNFIPEQYGIGQTTKVRLNYILYDYDIDTCNFTVDATQVQYKKHSDSTWLNATLSGQSTLVTSFEDGKQHNADYQPLYVDMGDVDGIYDFRLKPHDGTQYATDYVTTTSFYVDNTPPAAPVLSQAQTNFAYQITVTGSAEANSAVKIYAGTVLAATATADASGYFLAYPVVISETNKAITAICYDVAGNKSPTSNTMEPTIGDVIKTVTDQDLTAVIAFPKDSLDFDFIPQLAKVATIDAQTTNGDPPTYYQYLNAFDLNFLGHDTATANSTITVTLNFTQTIRVPSLVKVYSWHNGAWSSSGITINSIATTATQTTLCFSPTYFGRFAIMDPIDPYPPVVRSVKLGSSPIVTGNYYAGNSTLNLDLYDADSGIASFSVQILSTTATAPIYSTSSRNVGTKEVQVAILPDTPLSDGTYYIQVIISDKSINSTTYTSGQFVVSDTLLQLQALQAPNPYNPDKGDLTIAYNMNQAAEVKCYILDQAGNVVFDASYALTDEDGAAGYHLLTWNGRNKFNQIVPNGLYYGYVTAKSVSDHKRAKFKIAIIR